MGSARRSVGQRAALWAGLALVAPAIATVPAAAATASAPNPTVAAALAPTTAPAPGQQSVTLVLTPGNRALLAKLANTAALAPTTRAALLAQAVPTADTRARVTRILTAHGLTITGETSWNITASGSPSAVTALVGSRLAVRRAQNNRPQNSVNRATADGAIPSALRGLVTGIAGGDDHSHHLHPVAVKSTASSLRSLYHGSIGTPTGGSPLTVATIQFSGWNSGDLRTFAGVHGLADPVASGQYVGVSVDGQLPSILDNSGGNQEVALDQETLLWMSPHANQRAYFAPNTNQGFIDAIYAVANDVEIHHLPIAALSISWGDCEPDYGDADFTALHAAFTAANAAGVTVFSASGDNGAFDCGTSSRAVDYPSSDPSVIGVGGTTINGTTQTAWSPRPGDSSASGGGESTYWPRSAYQPAIGSGGRLVPDLAAEADPDSGLEINVDGGVGLFGGTSLAAPLTAALFTNSLADHGWTSGVGNVLPSLYAAPATSFTDITAGNNGYFTAHAGYDEVTGRGTPLWDRLRSSYDGAPVLTTHPYWRLLTIPLTVTVPAGMTFTHWRAGIGAAPAPRILCSVTGGSAAPPTSVTALADGHLNVWVQGYSPSTGSCYTSRATVIVDRVAPVAHPRATTTAPGTIWSSNPLRITWNWTDGGSGLDVAHCVTSTVTTVSSSPTTVQATCRDRAGNLTTASYLAHIDRTPPTVVALGNPASVTSSSRVAFRWLASDGESGVASLQFRSARASLTTGALGTFSAPVAATAAGEGSITGQPGYRYCLQARALDKVGNATTWSPMRCATVPLDDRALIASAGWHRDSAPGWMGGTSTSTTSAARTLTSAPLRVAQLGVVATTCPTCGSVAAYVGTVRVGTFNLQASTTTARSLLLLPRLAAARAGAVRLVTLNAGRMVRIDALAVSSV